MRWISVLMTGLFTMGLTVTAAAGEQPYSPAAFALAVKAGKPVIVEFAADWCPTCKAQRPVAAAVLAQRNMRSVTLFVADYDKEVALKQSLGVVHQATFVVFKAGKEVDRATGITQRADIESLFDEVL